MESLFDGMDFMMNVTRARLEMYSHAVVSKCSQRGCVRRRLVAEVKDFVAANHVDMTSIERMVVVGGR